MIACAALSPHHLIRSGPLLQHHQSFRDFEAAALDEPAHSAEYFYGDMQFYECTSGGTLGSVRDLVTDRQIPAQPARYQVLQLQ
jgi:hypothetical protein